MLPCPFDTFDLRLAAEDTLSPDLESDTRDFL
jgi:hypothetical protein